MVAFAAAAGIAPAGAGADARLDKSFGKAGYVTTSAKGKTLVGYGAAVVGNRVVLAGQVDTKSGDGQVIVARYRSNGRLDRDFAKRGVFESEPAEEGRPLPRHRGDARGFGQGFSSPAATARDRCLRSG